MNNSLIDETRKRREQLAVEVSYDFHALCESIYMEQETHPTVNLKEGHARPACNPRPQQVAEPKVPYGK
jgi:hypothetical protein